MKKTITKIFVIALLVIFNIQVIYAINADTLLGALYVNANLSVSEVEAGKSFQISVSSKERITDYEVSVNNSTLGTPKVVGKYNGSSESTSGTKKIVKMFQLAAQADKTPIASGANLATFEYTVPSNIAAGNYNITVTLKAVSTTGEMINATATKTIKVVLPKSTNANLSSITVNGKAIESFNKNTVEYTLDTVENNVTSITVGGVSEDSKATVSGTGTINLKEGKNTIQIKVTAESGLAKTYTLTVTRKELPKSTNANLSTITVNGKALEGFNKNTTSYDLATVENGVTTITIGGTAEDSKAKVSGIGTINLKDGKNTIQIKVTAESGATKVYTLTVTRKEKEEVSSSEYGLKNIIINGKEITNFAKDKYEYILESVPYDTDSITIEAQYDKETSIVAGTGKQRLKVGNNEFTIIVMSEDNTKETYTINIVRKAAEINEPVVKDENNNSNFNEMAIYIVIAVTAVAIVAVTVIVIISRRKI